MQIQGIETADGVYIRAVHKEKNMVVEFYRGQYLVNGELPVKTWADQWYKVGKVPHTIEKIVKQPNINRRYELIDPAMESVTIPAVLLAENVLDSENDWLPEYALLKSLYNFKSDEQPSVREPVEFTYIKLMEVRSIDAPIDFGFEVARTQWVQDGKRVVTAKDVQHQLLDRIVFPDVILPNKPSAFTSEMVYKIVRDHIKKNINPKAAIITSDYDFCLTVEKVIPLAEDEPFSVDVNLFKSRAKPKYERRIRRHRQVPIFRMTHAGANYKGYPVISDLRADNHRALRRRMEQYLDALMAEINAPVSDCPHCKGLGVIVAKEVPPLQGGS